MLADRVRMGSNQTEIFTWEKYNVARIRIQEPWDYGNKSSENSLRKPAIYNRTFYSAWSWFNGYYVGDGTSKVVSIGENPPVGYYYINSTGSQLYKLLSETWMDSSGNVRHVSDTKRSSTIDEAGDFIEIVKSKDEFAYPDNGKHTDGYWYVKIN